MSNYIQVSIPLKQKEQDEIIIALLSEQGYEGFEESDGMIKAFIKEALYSQSDLQEIAEPMGLSYSTAVIPQQNWNAHWESSFEPVTVENFAAVRASFHPENKNVKHEIIITPKMSFGTGHHATTYMMIKQMERLDLAGKTVVDFGTGTAVLAILAEKMGAAAITAIDNDEWSIENAKENIQANHCRHIGLHQSESIPQEGGFDVILANINLNVILANMQAIASAARPGAQVLLSGFLRENEEEITRSLQEHQLEYRNTTHRGEWLCINAVSAKK